MPSRNGAVHVATTRRKYKDRVYETHLLRRNYREDGKVKHETLGNISHLPGHVVDLVRRSLKGETFVSAEGHFECVRSLPHGHVAAVLGTMRNLGLDKLISAKPCRERDLVAAMIVDRILDPGSKLAASRALAASTAQNTLGEVLSVTDASEDELYAAMDWLLLRQAQIEDGLARRHLDNALVLYDVTSSYFEGVTCPLAKYGHNRDGKPGRLQIVIGLLCNHEGRPVAVEVFDGDTGDPVTIASQVTKLKERFGLERVVLVGDRGMITDARIREDLNPIAGLSWITALRAPAIKKLAEEGSIVRSLFDETDLAEITSREFPGQRLVVCRNPLLAEERARKREELLAATEAEFAKIAAATQRGREPLRGAAEIGLKVGAVRNKYKVGKHFDLQITEDSFRYVRKTEQIAREAALDGIYVVRTNVPQEEFTADQTVRAYKSLSVVERAFRTMKMVDLKVRPIYHRLEGRVRAHVFLCMLAYCVEWQMRQALAPMLFDDHDKPAAEAGRGSAVQKAQRSEAAKKKASTKQTPDGFAVQSFRDLLSNLATIVRNWVRPKGMPIEPFAMTTTPTPNQHRILDLLGVAVNNR
jgi:transposase